ncbi:hypothetical protein GCM10028801_06920 [Nocardioides maradonensis]
MTETIYSSEEARTVATSRAAIDLAEAKTGTLNGLAFLLFLAVLILLCMAPAIVIATWGALL